MNRCVKLSYLLIIGNKPLYEYKSVSADQTVENFIPTITFLKKIWPRL